MELRYNTILEQSQVMSQNQIQSLQILAMDNMELNEYLQNEYLENPLLEHTSAEESSANQKETPVFVSDHGKHETYRAWNEGERSFDIASEDPFELKYFLLDQLNRMKYSVTENRIMEILIDCLDENGFFSMNIEDIAEMTGVEAGVIEKCLGILRELQPIGIFAEDLEHCLIKQLENEGQDDPIIKRIILEHLNDVAEGKISTISRALDLPTSQVRQAINLIKKLNPRPLMGVAQGRTEYIMPDILFSYKDQQWNIELNDKWMGEYQLSSYYMNLMKTATDKELLDYFKKKMESTKFVIRSIEQRRMTILKISRAILDWQMDYFMGRAPLKSMTMSDIALRIDMHVSTVSRGIKGKYLQSPRGTVRLKDLFATGVVLGGENIETSDSVKTLIRELIDNEDHEKPYSDQELAEILEGKNISISRRTVAKYRKELGISTTYERKYSI